jgi:hypothetical protein
MWWGYSERFLTPDRLQSLVIDASAIRPKPQGKPESILQNHDGLLQLLCRDSNQPVLNIGLSPVLDPIRCEHSLPKIWRCRPIHQAVTANGSG